MTFGLTPDGFNAKRVVDVKNSLDDEMIAEFGDVNLAAQSVFGQIIGVLSKVLGDSWENLEDVYFSQYPNSAEGIALDNVVQLNGITRLPAQRTQVTAIASGVEATLLPAGSLARIPETQEVFFSVEDVIITRNRAYSSNIEATDLLPIVYSVLINGVSFSYSLPIITFTGSFVTGNSIVVTINGTQLAAVPFNTDSDTTLEDIAVAIAGFSGVASAVDTAPDTINITPDLGSYIVVNSIQITGGISQPTFAITFDIPATLDDIASYLSAVINNGSQPVTSTSLDNVFEIIATDSDVPFSLSVGTGLNVISRSSPVVFQSQNFGPIAAPIGTLTEILTPISGWDSITNVKAGVLGRFVETDAELRLRRLNSLRLLGAATVEAIRARLLQEVPGVTSAFVFENREIVQEDVLIVFADDFVTGNDIVVTLNSIILPTVSFTTDHLTTITILAQLLQNQSEISSAVVGGTGNRTITLSMENFEQITIDNIQITGGASQTTYVVQGGRPAKSFEAVVQGGTDEDIANKIWETKPAGIQTFGNTQFNITDSQGDLQAIFFSRPTPIYIWITVTLTLYPEETFPSNGLDLVQQAIFNYGSGLGVGVDVLLQRVNCQIFDVPGVASGIMQIAATNSPNDSPSFGSSDIPISETQISDWDLSRITVTI